MNIVKIAICMAILHHIKTIIGENICNILFIKGTRFNLIYRRKKKKTKKQTQYALIFLLPFYSWHMWKKYKENKEHNENFETCALDSADVQICFFGALSKAQAACSVLDRTLWA